MSLDLIRNKHIWFTRIVLVILAVIFVVGIGFMSDDFGALTGAPNRAAVRVNGEDISMVTFYNLRDSIKRDINAEGDLPQQYADQINGIALNQLINAKLLAQKAGELGFKVTDEELNEAISSNPIFQIDGKFVGRERYQNFVQQALNQDVGEFENSYREDLVIEKLRDFIDETAMVTDEELFAIYRVQNEKVNLYYISFSGQDFIDSYSPTEEEIKEYYEARKSGFKTPELRKIRYFTLSPDVFEKNIEVSDDEIGSYYNAYSEEFLSEDGTPLPLEQVKGEIESKLKAQRGEVLREQFLAAIANPEEGGKTIDTIAEEYSVKSINESGAFSAVEVLEDIPPGITRQAFSNETGQTAIIPLGTTIWVMEVNEITPPREKTLQEAKEDIIVSLKKEQSVKTARKKAEEALEKLKAVKRENLSTEAKKLGLELKETGYFSRMEAIPGVNAQELRGEAFELDEGSAVSNKIYADRDNFYIVSFKEKQGADTENFELKKVELKEQQLQKQRSEIMGNWLQEMRRQAEIIPNNDLFPAQG